MKGENFKLLGEFGVFIVKGKKIHKRFYVSTSTCFKVWSLLAPCVA